MVTRNLVLVFISMDDTSSEKREEQTILSFDRGDNGHEGASIENCWLSSHSSCKLSTFLRITVYDDMYVRIVRTMRERSLVKETQIRI